jgi:hypothetical protein
MSENSLKTPQNLDLCQKFKIVGNECVQKEEAYGGEYGCRLWATDKERSGQLKWA